MKWLVTITYPDSSVKKTTFTNKIEAEDYYNKVVTEARQNRVAIKVHLKSVGQVLKFKRKEKDGH